MDLDKLNNWMQIVGIFAVVASLIFVGLQIKQTHEIALAGQFQERSAMAIEFWNGTAQNVPAVRYLGNRFLDEFRSLDGISDDITVEEAGLLFIFARKALTVFDNHHFQYTAGF